jgi:hypothetical protein
MKKLLTATVAALAMLATVPTAHAAQFWTEPGTCIDGTKTCIDVHMKGEIVKDDAARFNKAVAKVPKGNATFYLDSVGGSSPAMCGIFGAPQASDFTASRGCSKGIDGRNYTSPLIE